MIYPLLITFFYLIVPEGQTPSPPIAGHWTIVDDKGRETSVVEITESNGEYTATVVKLLPEATLLRCEACPGETKGKALEGMAIFWGLKPYKDHYDYGKILDPESGKVYDLKVSRQGDLLEVRGYIGTPLFGRSQYWPRAADISTE
ncbi:MAG: DUF2147 domain-containing protein [Saprospiraceae bacterium]|nr:DUF2147 domain-containing protein [Saprospiraceae bacterium]